MKLYRHYKNKPYKYVGLARHSETGEEVVIYETLYESPGGKVWVRPKTMFHENIEHEGRTRPRFAPVEFAIEETPDVADQDILAIAGLMKNALGAWDESAFRKKLADHRGHHLLTAKVEGQAVGFKLGYERNEETFYSWLGGARGDFRGLGIANALMGAQHAWAKMRGYKTIETKTKNRFRAMLILNLRHGFEVVAIETAGGQEPKIVLRKTL